MTTRIDYDDVAAGYDAQPYRGKQADPELEEFAAGRALKVLDLACGTGNQICANRAAFPQHSYTGVDASGGMLGVAREKSDDVTWVQASADHLPFDDGTFDFVTCQFAYHHFPDQRGAFAEVHRVLRGGGRFVLTNVAPHEYRDGVFYRMFPGAFELDARDFIPTDDLVAMLGDIGFTVSVATDHAKEGETWGEFADYVSVRTNNSHLTAMSDDDYAEGMRCVRQEVERHGRDARVHNPIVIKRFRADHG